MSLKSIATEGFLTGSLKSIATEGFLSEQAVSAFQEIIKFTLYICKKVGFTVER